VFHLASTNLGRGTQQQIHWSVDGPRGFKTPTHRELRKKLMLLEQGDKSVQDYYAELQKGLQRCGIVEGHEDALCHFYSGLRRDIQDIVDYKEFNTVNKLF
jgi:hypothetical protein